MLRNVGTPDRILRALAAAALIAFALLSNASPLVRIAVVGGSAAYMLFTALSGTCLGYRLMGRSTCPVPRRQS